MRESGWWQGANNSIRDNIIIIAFYLLFFLVHRNLFTIMYSFGTAHFNLTLTCMRLFNYLINISIYSLITCKYCKEQWCKHIHVTTNCMPGALICNALVQIYLWTCTEYALMKCAHVDCIHLYGVRYNRITTRVVSLPFCVLSSQLNYYLICVARPILVLAAYRFHSRCIACLQFSIAYKELLCTS